MARTSSAKVSNQGRSTIRNPNINFNKDDGTVLLSLIRGEELSYTFTFKWLEARTESTTTDNLASRDDLVTEVSDNLEFYTNTSNESLILKFSENNYVAPDTTRGYTFVATTSGTYAFDGENVTGDETDRTWTVDFTDTIQGETPSAAIAEGDAEAVTSLRKFQVTFHTNNDHVDHDNDTIVLTFDEGYYVTPNAVSSYSFTSATDTYSFPYSAITVDEEARTWEVKFVDATEGVAPTDTIDETDAEPVIALSRTWDKRIPLETAPSITIVEGDNSAGDGAVPSDKKTDSIYTKLDLEVVNIDDANDPRNGEPVSPYKYTIEIPGGDKETSTEFDTDSTTATYSTNTIVRHNRRFYKVTASPSTTNEPGTTAGEDDYELLSGDDHPELTSDWADSVLAPSKPMYAFFGLEVTDEEQTWKPVRGLIEILYSATYE